VSLDVDYSVNPISYSVGVDGYHDRYMRAFGGSSPILTILFRVMVGLSDGLRCVWDHVQRSLLICYSGTTGGIGGS